MPSRKKGNETAANSQPEPEAAAASGRKLTKNEKRRLKEKQQKAAAREAGENVNNSSNSNISSSNSSSSRADAGLEDVEIEYVSAEYNDPTVMDEFQEIFNKFAKPEELTAAREEPLKKQTQQQERNETKKLETIDIGGEIGNSEEGDEGEGGEKPLSKKKRKLASRLSVAELKQLVPRPDVVEAHDVTSADPRLLVYLKSYRNTVPVPRHWCHKRKYLQGKRGIEKVPFQLPEWIAETGIAKIRESVMEQEKLKKAKQKSRDRLQPKMGKIDIDYQVLHDAFFKYQRKPKLTGHGDLYYEGKEFEIDMKQHKAGVLSPELLELLEMNADGTVPPPWLINMQRYGPPPSYPSMRIPGLNAPIPAGAQFGYQVGGWGKPPVDEYGRPLYGDVFGSTGEGGPSTEENIDKSRWGEVTVVEEESEEEESDEEDEDDDGQSRTDMSGMDTPSTLDGTHSTITGLETPDTIDLRKRAGTDTPDTMASYPKELYHVLQETKTSGAKDGGTLFGSDHGYVLPSKGGVELSIDPDQLQNQLDELGDQEGMRDVYDAEKTKAGIDGPDLADLDQANQKRKRRADTSMAAKRHKDFKF